MSKQRPSSVSAKPAALTRKSGEVRTPATFWRKRVFKNSYTRGGQRIEIKGWSVKIQHRGTRRTFSLGAKSRDTAAIEAQAIHQTIVTQGWDAAPIGPRPPPAARRPGGAINEQSWPKTDLRYWKRRLLRRPHASPTRLAVPGELSVRIDHAGAGHYFPLGTLDEDDAAFRAREIYVTNVRDGWDSVRQRHPCELTVAVHWTDNPLAWTYATLHTITGSPTMEIEPRRVDQGERASVAVIEADVSVRRALSICVNLHNEFVCDETYESAASALAGIARRPPRLVLVNRVLPHLIADAFVDRLKRIAPEVSVLLFSTYEDSDQLFKATPGGASGYLLKRTPADRLFEPIAGAVDRDASPANNIATQVQRYFQNLVLSLSRTDRSGDIAKLTHREHEILNLLSRGYVDKEIADSLGISIWTVHGHLKRIYEKLAVHTRTEAAIRYLHK